jgi:protease I
MKVFRYYDFIKESSYEKSAVIITGEGFQDAELFNPKSALEDAGYNVIIASIKTGDIKAYNSNKKISVDKLVSEIKAKDYDILILPGGKAPDNLRKDDNIISFVNDFYKSGKKIAAICHGPQILISANVVKNKKMTCFSDMKEELINAGAKYIDKELVIDGQFITSRNPNDLEIFCKEIVK